MRGKSIGPMSERRRFPWTPEAKEQLDACLSCTNLHEGNGPGTFSELEFIDDMDKYKRQGISLTGKQLNRLAIIYHKRVLGIKDWKPKF